MGEAALFGFQQRRRMVRDQCCHPLIYGDLAQVPGAVERMKPRVRQLGPVANVMFTGRYPRGVFDFVEGVVRWHDRVIGYAATLVIDAYPPFRLAP